MGDVSLALGQLALLRLSFGAGRLVNASLAERHRGPGTTGSVRNSAGLLVTLTAIVLGLLLTTVNASFDKTGDDLRKYGAGIVLLDRDLDALGAPMEPARASLRRYVASVLASNWPGEPAPGGPHAAERGHGAEIDSPQLGDLLYALQADLRAYAPPDAAAGRVQAAALDHAEAVLAERWTMIGEAHSSITPQFLAVVALWLALLLLAFGLIAPRDPVGVAASGFVALSVAGAVFLALELDGPLDGLVIVSSEPMRHALYHIDRVPDVTATDASSEPGAPSGGGAVRFSPAGAAGTRSPPPLLPVREDVSGVAEVEPRGASVDPAPVEVSFSSVRRLSSRRGGGDRGDGQLHRDGRR